MNVEIRRIKDSPYKLVCCGTKLIGIFDSGNFINRSNMNEKQKNDIGMHADTLCERLEVADA